MYTRYTRGPDGIYRRETVEEPVRETPVPPQGTPVEVPVISKDMPHEPDSAEKKPGLLDSLLSRQFEKDDLLLAAIVLLLLIDGGDEDWLATLVALAYLLL